MFLGPDPPAAGLLPGSVTFSLAPTETLDEPTPEIRSIAEELFPVEDRLRRAWEAVSKSPDEDAMFEGRMAGDLPTELLTTIECVLEDQLRPAVESLERAARVSEDELRREFHQQGL